MSKIKLLPCPYCGNDKDFSFNCFELHPQGIEPQVYEAAVQCLDCDLQTASSINSPVCLFYTREEAKQSAADIWNKFVKEISFHSDLNEDFVLIMKSVLESWRLGLNINEDMNIYKKAEDLIKKYEEHING